MAEKYQDKKNLIVDKVVYLVKKSPVLRPPHAIDCLLNVLYEGVKKDKHYKTHSNPYIDYGRHVVHKQNQGTRSSGSYAYFKVVLPKLLDQQIKNEIQKK